MQDLTGVNRGVWRPIDVLRFGCGVSVAGSRETYPGTNPDTRLHATLGGVLLVLPTIVLVATVTLALTTLLLLLLGRHLRISSRLLGLLLAGLVAVGSTELAARLWGLVPSYTRVGAGVVLLAGVVVVFALPYWNPIGQVFLGSFVAAAGTYLVFGGYVTVAGGLSPLGILASAVLLLLELLALLVSGYFAFEGCDILCRTRPTRAVPAPDPTSLPRVTLQVPAYNEPADMLIKTIQSLEAIDYPYLDILVVDNNTEDPETWRLVAEYCAGRERVRFKPSFRRTTGETGTVSRRVAWIDGSRPVPSGAPVVLQAARWDRLKDPAGVIELFRDHLSEADPRIRLVVAGPGVDGVADDPEGREILEQCVALRRTLPAPIRERVHLSCSPMDDEDETGVVVNALQRYADVVMLKSVAEGFGLAVAEAMWKRRPVVSTRVGGIQDQIEHNRSGILVDDPADRAAFAAATAQLLSDPNRARAIGARAHDRVRDRFLAPRQLTETLDLIRELR
jgi:glycosyltransferase involved in cell wall biosynthesis